METVAGALTRCGIRDDWRLAHLCSLLSGFARDGDRVAEDALEKKYRMLYEKLETLRFRRGPVFYQRQALEQLCVARGVNKALCLQIAGDLGRLYLTRSDLRDGEFSWTYDIMKERYADDLRNAAETSPEIACFIAREEAWRQMESTRIRKPRRLDQMQSRRRSIYLKTAGDQMALSYYAERYRRADDPKVRTEELMNFSHCPYPYDPTPILADAKSPDVALSWAAVLALGNIRNPAVREFALAEIGRGWEKDYYLPLLTRNYQPEDNAMLEVLVDKTLKAGNLDRLHWVYREILGIFDWSETGPKRLLPVIYETIPCACCRRGVVKLLDKFAMLTATILEECRYDSDEDTREFALNCVNQTYAP